MISLSIPYPPSVNHYFIQRGKGKGWCIGSKGIAYRNDVYHAVRTKRPPEPLTCRLHLKITAIMPDRRRRDLDNLMKAVQDSLQNAGIYQDDSQVDWLEVIRGPIHSPGRLQVEIREYGK